MNAGNFSIPGLTVATATLSADKKSVTLSVTGAEVSKTYTVTISGVKVGADVQPDITSSFTTPSQNELFKPELGAKDTVLKSDGASSTLVTFKLLDAAGNLMTDAQDVEVAFSSTFGNMGEKRVAVQNGVATVLFTSEALTSDKVAEINAQVVEAQDKNLIGLKSTTSILLTPNPETVDPTTGALMTEAEAFQADRVVVYFNKPVKVSDFTYASGVNKGKIDPAKADIVVTTAVNNDLSGGDQVDVLGLMSVPGNDKALYLILDDQDADFPLVDNANVKVEFTDKRGSIVVPSTKSFKLTDARKPAMLSVAREGLKKIKVTFSEPVNRTATTEANWVIDGKRLDSDAYGVAGARATASVGTFDPETGEDTRHIVTIELGQDQDGNQIYFKSGVHSIQGANIGDWAQNTDPVANVMNTQTLDFEIPVDNGAPGATVEVQSPEQYVLAFDKDINQTAVQLAAVLKLQKYNTDTNAWEDVTDPAIEITDISATGKNKFLVEVKKDWTKVYTTSSSNKNYYNDSYRLHIDKDKVMAASNGIKNAEINLPLVGAMKSPDVTSPTINRIVETPGTEVGTSYDVTMSEPVKINLTANSEGLTPSEAQDTDAGVPVPTAEFIKKDNSVTVPAVVSTAFVDKEEKVIRVTPSKELEAGEWTLVVRSISDDVGNTAASATKDFTVVKEVVDSAFKVTWSKADFDSDFSDDLATDLVDTTNDYVFVKFSKAVAITGDFKNALKTSNYTLNGAALPQGTQILADIQGYDDMDNIVDSITIKLPNGTITDPERTVINISPYLESVDGKLISNPGEKKLPFNYGALAAKTVNSLDKLKEALADDSVRSIKLSDDIAAPQGLTINRLVNIDLNGNDLTGNVTVNATEGGKMTISATTAGQIDGNLTVNTPNADFEIGANVTVTGITTIKDVASSTFVNNGTLQGVTIEDANGTRFENNSIVGKVTVATTGAVTLDGTAAIGNVEVTKAAKLSIAGNVTNLTAKTNGVVITAGKENATNLIVEGGSFKDKDGKDITEGVQNPTADAAAKLKAAQEAVAALFADATKAALKAGVDQAAIDTAKAKVDALANTVTEKAGLLDDVQAAQNLLDAATDAAAKLQAAQTAVEGLFADYSTKAALAAGVDQAAIDAAKAKVDALANTVTEKAGLLDDVQAAQNLLDAANLQAAQAAVEGLFEDYSTKAALAAGVDQAAIDAAKAKVDALANTVAEKAGLQADVQAAQDLLTP